jgi:hypothetical protein
VSPVSRLALILCLSLPACAQTWFSNLAQNPTTSSCSVTWTTAVPTTAHITYGLAAGSYTKSTTNTAQYSRTATQVISGLTAGTTVSGGYYAVLSNATGLNFTDTSVNSGTTYYYVVAALNAAGQQSPYSNQVTAPVP